MVDVKDIQLQRLTSENIRLTNEVAKLEGQLKFYIEEVTRQKEENNSLTDTYKGLYEESENVISTLKSKVEQLEDDYKKKTADYESLKKDYAALECDYKETKEAFDKALHENLVLTDANKGLMDTLNISDKEKNNFNNVIQLMLRRHYESNSDQSQYLKGYDPQKIITENGEIRESDIADLVARLVSKEGGATVAPKKQKPSSKPAASKKDGNKSDADTPKTPRKRNTWTAKDMESFGIDASNLPLGSNLIRRKEKGYDVWYFRTFEYRPGTIKGREYKIGRFNVPGEDPMSSKHPMTILKGNPILPSLAAFYISQKVEFGRSEEQILEMIKDMGGKFPQPPSTKRYMKSWGWPERIFLAPCYKSSRLHTSHKTTNQGYSLGASTRRQGRSPTT